LTNTSNVDKIFTNLEKAKTYQFSLNILAIIHYQTLMVFNYELLHCCGQKHKLESPV